MLNHEELARDVQSLFKAGLVLIVGSGASAAHGLPTMGQLADSLRTRVPNLVASNLDCVTSWRTIDQRLQDGLHLEAALADIVLPPALHEAMTSVIVESIQHRELEAINRMVDSGSSPLSRLLPHLLRVAPVVDVITTNYDRLVEASAALAEVRVDTMFYGHTIGRLDADLSKNELLEQRQRTGRRGVVTQHKPHISLSKPHGSLDWSMLNERPIRTDLPLAGAKRVVIPGSSKYESGYEIPFDAHRERANRAIDRATGFLTIGYGFNDNHLQTHLSRQFSKVPSLNLSFETTESARAFLDTNRQAIAVESAGAGNGAMVHADGKSNSHESEIWNIDVMLKEVLGI